MKPFSFLQAPQRNVDLPNNKCPYGATNMANVNNLFGGQGKADHSTTDFGDGTFGQQNTVETLFVGPGALFDSNTPYTQDPPGTAGTYAVAMIPSDAAWLDFTAVTNLEFFYLAMDISSINLPNSCDPADPQRLQAPVFILTTGQKPT